MLNCFFQKEGDTARWKRLPGLLYSGDTGLTTPRGMLYTGSEIYAAMANGVVKMDASGHVTRVFGTLGGDEPVTWARNNASPAPNILVHSDLGTFEVTTGGLVAFADGDLPATNSLSAFDGYFVWTTQAGQIWASDLNSVNVNALSFQNIQSSQAGVLRGVVSGSVFYAMGVQSIEPWQNVGSSPFPLAKASTTIPVGLAGKWCVAGVQGEWDRSPLFVATDNTVRSLEGFQTRVVSTPAIQGLIQGVSDKNTLRAYVYTFSGNAMWGLTSPSWTVEYNAATGQWHERKSHSLAAWRGTCTVQAFGKWFVGDRASSHILIVSEAAYDEAGDPLVFGADSVPMKDFPARAIVSAASLDFTLGAGRVVESPDTIRDPHVMMTWSHDGGARWAANAIRPLGVAGRYVGPVRVHRLGQTTHHGFRMRWRVSDPVHVSFMGGTMEGEDRAA